MRGKHGKDKFNGVRQLHRNNGIVRQSRFDEMGRQGGDRAIGFREAQAFGGLARNTRLVERSEQGRCVGLPCQNPAKQSVEGWRYVGLDHRITSLAAPNFATRFPGDIPSRRSLPVVVSYSSARSIVLER